MQPSPRRVRRSLIASAIATLTTAISGAIAKRVSAQATNSTRDRYTRGIETLKRVGGADYDRAMRPLQAFFPDLARLSVEYPFGDIMSRPGLHLQQREIINVAALTALGSVRPALKYHIHGMLNVGCSPQEVVETD